MSAPSLTLTTVNIGAPDPAALAEFYQRLLPDWRLHSDPDQGDHFLRPPADGVALSFQLETPWERPVWPTVGGKQQMMMHLEIKVEDLDAALDHAVKSGATLADFQPQDDVRVCLDPAGHPFCLWIEE